MGFGMAKKWWDHRCLSWAPEGYPLERKIWNYTAPSLIYGWHSHLGLSSRNSRYWIVLKISFKNTIEPVQSIQTKIYRFFGATVHIFGPTNSLNVFIYSYLFAKWSWKLNFELQTINGSFYGQFICICCGWVSCRVVIPKKTRIYIAFATQTLPVASIYK